MVNYDPAPGSTVRVRLINARAGDFSGAPMQIAVLGVPFKVIAKDGHDINQPQYIQNQLLPLGMAQRYDVEFTMPQSGSVQIQEQQGLQTLTFGQGSTNDMPPDLNMLPEFNYTNYGIAQPDPRLPKKTFDINYNLVIGENLSINGQLFPNTQDLVVKEGDLVHIHFVNTSNMTHPMHLHGHVYSILAVNGVPVTGSPIHADTVIVPPYETVDVAFLADDPGIWVFHCHVLAHAAAGLMMRVRYQNVYSPYVFGPGTGNAP